MHGKEAQDIWQALWMIIVADMSMGIDNMLAVGAASHGNLFLLLFGLILSIPFVVFMSTMLAKLMDRYPIILWIGAALLGKVGGEMMATDPFIVKTLRPAPLGGVRIDGRLRGLRLRLQQVAAQPQESQVRCRAGARRPGGRDGRARQGPRRQVTPGLKS